MDTGVAPPSESGDPQCHSRVGAGGVEPPFRIRTAALGAPVVSLDRALALAVELEDEELIRRLGAGP